MKSLISGELANVACHGTAVRPSKERSRICRKAHDYIRRPDLQASPPEAPAKDPPLPDPNHLSSAALEAVIDTNVLLDWLVFGDPAVARLSAALRDGTLHWVATAPMLDELRHVLGRPPLSTRRADHVEGAIAQFCHLVVAPPAAPPRMLCSDPDDQKFIDLALHRRCPWLISRDRALLQLRRRALACGVQVCQPADWNAAGAPAITAVRTSP